MTRRRLLLAGGWAASAGLLFAAGCGWNTGLASQPGTSLSHPPHDLASTDKTLAALWQRLRSGPSSQRLKALREIDARIEKGMIKNEVLALYPPDCLVEKPHKEGGSWLVLRHDLGAEILAPHAWGLWGYQIRFGPDGRVAAHSVMLGGDW